jgi:hypothetical protein
MLINVLSIFEGSESFCLKMFRRQTTSLPCRELRHCRYSLSLRLGDEMIVNEITVELDEMIVNEMTV